MMHLMNRKFSYKMGELVEQRIGHSIERFFEAPLLDGAAAQNTWYRIPVEAGRSGDGSEYHIYIKIGNIDKLCIFLSGGGVAWNEYTAARPVTGGAVAARLPNYYWNNLRPFTQIMNINAGITEIGNSRNPLDDWSFVVITYATGDFHVGNNVIYIDESKVKNPPNESSRSSSGGQKEGIGENPAGRQEEGTGENLAGRQEAGTTEKTACSQAPINTKNPADTQESAYEKPSAERLRPMYFHGHKNFRESMHIAKLFFPQAEEILLAGDSAGAFAVPALAGEIVEMFYPECEKITLLSDSGQLCYDKWQDIIRDVWKSEKKFWAPVSGENLTVEWYRELYKKYGDRFSYLYAASSYDYLLSAYLNDMKLHNEYATDHHVQEMYHEQMKDMIRELKNINPDFGFFIYPWKNLRFNVGGTVHTAVRQKRFYLGYVEGHTMADWLGNALNGNILDLGKAHYA